jgi:hypothetical protein
VTLFSIGVRNTHREIYYFPVGIYPIGVSPTQRNIISKKTMSLILPPAQAFSAKPKSKSKPGLVSSDKKERKY